MSVRGGRGRVQTDDTIIIACVGRKVPRDGGPTSDPHHADYAVAAAAAAGWWMECWEDGEGKGETRTRADVGDDVYCVRQR